MKITKLPNGGELHQKTNGYKHWHWYLNGKLHREDGPAVEYIDGTKYWYIHGEQMSCTTQEQFKQLMRLKAFW